MLCRHGRENFRTFERRRDNTFNLIENGISYSSKVTRTTFAVKIDSLLNWLWQIQGPSARMTLDSTDLLLVQKQVISTSNSFTLNRWKPWKPMRFDLVLSKRNVDTNSNLKPLTKLWRSQRSINSEYLFSRNLFEIIKESISISTRSKALLCQ